MSSLPSIKVSVGAGLYHVFQDLRSCLSLMFFYTASLNLFFVGGIFVFTAVVQIGQQMSALFF